MKMLALLGLLLLACSADAAVIYLPVQHEHGVGLNRYYYGGSDPMVFQRAQRAAAARDQQRGPTVSAVPLQTYSDAHPYLPTAALAGVSPSDARNQAYQAMPRYFRMTDLLLGGKVQDDGTVIVPPTTSGTILIRPYVRPVLTPRPILILPKPPTAPATSVAQAR